MKNVLKVYWIMLVRKLIITNIIRFLFFFFFCKKQNSVKFAIVKSLVLLKFFIGFFNSFDSADDVLTLKWYCFRTKIKF